MGLSEQSSPDQHSLGDLRVSIQDLGGIDRCEVTISPGVTVLVGENATNRTSFLRALACVFGADTGTLKADADNGRVSLTTDEGRYWREFRREGQTVVTEGEPYLPEDDWVYVSHFACLLEANPIRQAVQRGDELRPLLMGPVDTEAIEREISELQGERQSLEERLTEIRRDHDRLPKLESRRRQLEEKLETVEANLSTVRDRIDEESIPSEKADRVRSLLDDIERLHDELDETTAEAETQREIIAELEDKRDELRAERSSISVPEDRLAEVTSAIDRLQAVENQLNATIGNLSSIVSGNETLLSGDDGVFDALGVSGEETPVSELSPSSQVVECWTCGTQVERQAIADRLGELRDLIERKREERSSVRDDLSELNSERDTIEKRIAERDELDDRLSDLDREVKRRRSTLRDLEEQSDDLRDRIADLRAEFEGLEELQERDLTDTYQEVSELEYERGHLEQELTEVTDEITEIEYEVGKKERLEEEIESIEAKISELRTRIDELERDVIERFNGQMDEILEILGYDNVTRVWLERVSASIATAENASFALHVVRESEDGTVYEDTVDHLSESEREVVGLVAALSGYLAHEVHERAPVVILDSLEAIDADRIAALVDYFTGVSGYVLVALLPEDAAALSDAYERLPAAALR